MIPTFSGLVVLSILYWAPGWIYLRASGLDRPTRFLTAIVVSYGSVTVLLEILGLLGMLGRGSVLASVVVLVAIAVRFPLGRDGFAPIRESPPWLALAACGFMSVATMVQALRPALFRLHDAVATWAPLASDIVKTGTLNADWVATPAVGLPRSVALIAASESLVTGSWEPAHGLVPHPLVLGLLLAGTVLLAVHLGGRKAGWIALVVVLASPLIHRSLYMHDDMFIPAFTVIGVVLALRASRWHGWVLAGTCAGAALAVKPLGLLAVAMIGAILVGRSERPSHWVAAAVGTAIGLPWYIANAIRFGNPVYPLLPRLFGESEVVRLIVEDANVARHADERSSYAELGGLATAAILIGIACTVWLAWRRRDAVLGRLTLAIVAAGTAFTAVWNITGYASRHMLTPVVLGAAFAAVGLAALGPRTASSPGASHAGAVLGVGLVVLAGYGVATDLYRGTDPPVVLDTGVLEILQGKWRDLNVVASGGGDLSEFGRVAEIWDTINEADLGGSVLSFDQRRYYVEAPVVFAQNIDAVALYLGRDEAAQHRALVEAGVTYLYDDRVRAREHPLFEEGPWRSLSRHPEWYRPLLRLGRYRLWQVIDG